MVCLRAALRGGNVHQCPRPQLNRRALEPTTDKMTETAPAATSVPTAAPAKAPKKKAAAKPAKKAGPGAKELILDAVTASKEKKGMSYVAMKKHLAAKGYDVEHKTVLVKRAIKSLVDSGALVQLRGSGASGSFKAKPAEKPKKAAKKAVAAPAPKAKKAVTPKKAARKPAAAKKARAAKASPKKTVKKAPAAKKVPAKKVPKSPKKATKKAASPKKAVTPKKPAKKAAKPKAKKPAAKKPAKK